MSNEPHLSGNKCLMPPDTPSYAAVPVQWFAKWIWTVDLTEGRHDFVFFRREFNLTPWPQPALLRITAEREYAFWINSVFIGRGPVLSDPRFKRFDTYDVSSYLREGANCIAALIYHDVSRCRWTAHTEARGFLCQLEAGDFTLASDETWSARRCAAYDPAGHFDDSTLAEAYDSRQAPAGWQKAGFNDADWPRAVSVIAGRNTLWSAKQPQARFFPWVNLIPSDLAPLDYKQICPLRVVQCGEVLQRRQASTNDIAVRMSLV